MICCAAETRDVKRVAYEAALKASTTHLHDYVRRLRGRSRQRDRSGSVRFGRDQDRRRSAGRRIAGLLGTDRREVRTSTSRVVNPKTDPTFGFMTLDHDGKIRMDCSSPYAMASLVKLKDQFDIAWGNDPDADRHGIVTPLDRVDESQSLPRRGDSLFAATSSAVVDSGSGRKTLVSSSLIDRVVAEPPTQTRRSAGGLQVVRARAVRRFDLLWRRRERGREFPPPRWHGVDDGQRRADLGLLAAEITARTGRDPGEHYQDLVKRSLARIITPASMRPLHQSRKPRC